LPESGEGPAKLGTAPDLQGVAAVTDAKHSRGDLPKSMDGLAVEVRGSNGAFYKLLRQPTPQFICSLAASPVFVLQDEKLNSGVIGPFLPTNCCAHYSTAFLLYTGWPHTSDFVFGISVDTSVALSRCKKETFSCLRSFLLREVSCSIFACLTWVTVAFINHMVAGWKMK
ncbi:hypothetical protein XENOCAPTIV_027079, partial [Xenoophorus captivus]